MMESMAQNCIVEEINAFKDITIEKSKLKKAMQDNKYLWDNFKQPNKHEIMSQEEKQEKEGRKNI